MEVGDMILEWGGDNGSRGQENGSGDMIMEVGTYVRKNGSRGHENGSRDIIMEVGT